MSNRRTVKKVKEKKKETERGNNVSNLYCLRMFLCVFFIRW